MHPADAVALGYRYPTPAAHDALVAAATATTGVVGRRLTEFVDAVGRLDLAAWEELHTVTLDLSPLFVPYVGHVIWGENYRRGRFMADLKADMERLGVDLGGELPDHIEPILRYLAVADDPRSDLTEVICGAVSTMQEQLRKESSDNPYLHLLDATGLAVEEYGLLTIRTTKPAPDLRGPRPSGVPS